MNRLFGTTVVETSGIRTIAGGGTNASNAGQALLNLSGVSITGNQTISDLKNFTSRPTVNGTGILLSGEAYPSNNPIGYITNQNVVFTTGGQIISGAKTFIDNFRISGSGIIANVTSGALLQFSGRNVLTLPDLAQSFRNVYISDTIGNDLNAQIGNINRPYKTAQNAWDAIVADGLYANNRSYILNFYEGSYSIIATNNWPSRVGIRGLGPENITLNLTHTSILGSQSNGYDFNIRDWGYQSVNLSITSQGGSWAGGLPQNGGNGGSITLYNCRLSTISSRGGNSSSSAFLAGTYGSIYLENCVGGTISLVNGTPSPLRINTSAQTIINSKINAINTQSNTSNVTIQLIDSELTSSFPTIDAFNTNRIIKNTRISSSTPSQEKYYFDYRIVSGNNVIKNLELTNSGIFSGNLTGIILTDNITGRNKLQYRNNAFVADFASGIYFSPFVESPNLVYNTGNQTISGLKAFNDYTDFKNNISVSGFYNFNTTNTGEPLDGQMSWHPDYGTVQIGMNGGQVVNPVGFKSFYRVKAASTIRKGKVVMALGGVGNSEYILAREAQNIGPSGQLIMGVSAEEILANNYGDVVAFGAVRGVNTSSYPQDSILYYDQLSTGGFTNIPPDVPNAKVMVGLNTTSSSNGIVFVRVTAGSELGGSDSNVKFSNLQNNDIIRYSTSGYWYNSVTSGNIVTSNDTITRMIKLTQAQYNALSPKDPTTFYVIVG